MRAALGGLVLALPLPWQSPRCWRRHRSSSQGSDTWALPAHWHLATNLNQVSLGLAGLSRLLGCEHRRGDSHQLSVVVSESAIR